MALFNHDDVEMEDLISIDSDEIEERLTGSGFKSTREANSGEDAFLIDDVLYIDGLGVAVVGDVLKTFHINDPIIIHCIDGSELKAKVIKIKRFRRNHDLALAGEQFMLVLDGVSSKRLNSGDVIYKA